MTVKLKVNGPIISNGDKWFYDWFEEDGTCPNDIINHLPTNGEDVEITINSYGGLVDQGNEIYTALKSYNGKVVVNVVMAGSAASIIAMAGSTVRMSPVGQMMIHNVSMGAGGDYHAMDKASEILQKANQSLASAYVLKTGLSQEEILEKMEHETWLTATEAKEYGFADEIMFENDERPAMVASASGMVSQNIITKFRALNPVEKNSSKLNVKIDMSEVTKLVAEKIEELKQNTIIDGKTLAEHMNDNKEPQTDGKSAFARFLF